MELQYNLFENALYYSKCTDSINAFKHFKDLNKFIRNTNAREKSETIAAMDEYILTTQDKENRNILQNIKEDLLRSMNLLYEGKF